MMRDCLIILLALLFCTSPIFAQTAAQSKEAATQKAQSAAIPATAAKQAAPAAAESGADLDKAQNMWEKMGKQTQSAKPTKADPATKAKEVPAKKK